MESLTTGLFSAICSGLVVGVVMLLFQTKMNKSVEDAKDANSLRFKNVTDKFQNLEKKTDFMSAKIDHLDDKMTSVTTKVSVILSDQKHLYENVSGLREEIRLTNAKVENFGKVIRKT